jgi:hypothetical protein
MLPNYHTRHNRQSLGFEGPDLSERCCTEILRCAPEIEASTINDLSNGRFSVKSASQPQQYHSVDLTKLHCSCPDWPRVQLCKHLTSVFIHTQGPEECKLRFKNAFKTPLPEKEGASERESAPEVQDAVPGSDDSAVLSGLGLDLISFTQQVMSAVSSSPAPETIQSLRSVRNQLTAVFVAAQSGGGPALPPAERIAPNQHSWPETVARMGVRRGQKRKRASNSDSVLAADRIGELNNCKCMRAREGPNGDPQRDEVRDPYGGGEKSGARTKDDVRSATANASMHAAANTVPALSQSVSWLGNIAGAGFTAVLRSQVSQVQVRCHNLPHRATPYPLSQVDGLSTGPGVTDTFVTSTLPPSTTTPGRPLVLDPVGSKSQGLATKLVAWDCEVSGHLFLVPQN